MAVESWISPKTTKDQPSGLAGHGFFAVQAINKGEVIAAKAGHIIDRATLEAHREIIQDSEMEISDGLYLAPLTAEELSESMIYINHSCEPNCGIGGTILLVAMRDIAAGEELTLDYALHYADPDYRMECSCGTDSCRHIVSGNDWQLPELQQRYAGYFSWYIDQKIKALQT